MIRKLDITTPVKLANESISTRLKTKMKNFSIFLKQPDVTYKNAIWGGLNE